MRDTAEIDVAVFGGGIAGLWLLNRLCRLGFDALLFEKNTLGEGQTLAAQGIIHSGAKYSFDGVMRPQTESLASMPQVWLDCIAGHGEVDLRGAQILASNHLVFTTGGLTSRIAAALASKTLRSRLTPLPRDEFPEIFRAREFNGQVHQLEEPVLATKTVLTALRDHAAGAHDVVLSARVAGVQRDGERVTEVTFDDAEQTRIRPRACVFTSGQDNEWFAEQLGLDKNKTTQRRPVRMILARGLPHRLYAHWLAADPQPRATITTHDLDGENIWYIGNLTEKTAGMGVADAVRAAHAEMSGVFPWLDWKRVRWALHDVNRAEPAAGKLLPSGATLTTRGNAALAWPTKLALAPALAHQTLRWLETQKIAPSHRSTKLPLPRAEIGRYPWEGIREWIQL